MPIRTATLNKQIKNNGVKLHLAMVARIRSRGAEHDPSELEQSLLETRRLLKEAAATRQTLREVPKQKAAKVLKVAKVAKPKAPKAAKPPKATNDAKDPKAAKGSKPSRAAKLAKKAEGVEADRKATRKSAKT